MIVVDASALGDALTRDGERGAQARSELVKDQHWVAPQHLIVETFSCVRGLLLGGKITDRRAWDAVEALGRVAVDVVSSRCWRGCGSCAAG